MMAMPDKQYESVCFFLPSGKTFTFRQARILVDNETVLVVGYVAMSDDKQKIVTFYKNAIAGVACCG